MRATSFVLLVLLLPRLSPAPAGAAEGTPFLYQGVGEHRAGSIFAEWQSAVGTREARPFSGQGFETGLLLDLVPLDGAGLRLTHSYLFSAGASPKAAFFAEGSWRLLDRERHGLDLELGFGFGRDFRQAWLPRVRVFVASRAGRLLLSGGTVAEFPLAEGRDAIDVMVLAALGVRVTESWVVGIEAAGEDLEGFFEEDEAEGGARLLAGPTVWLAVTGALYLKVNAAVCVTGRVVSGAREFVDPGLAARLALGYAF